MEQKRGSELRKSNNCDWFIITFMYFLDLSSIPEAIKKYDIYCAYTGGLKKCPFVTKAPFSLRDIPEQEPHYKCCKYDL